jgi:hypothetical protein
MLVYVSSRRDDQVVVVAAGSRRPQRHARPADPDTVFDVAKIAGRGAADDWAGTRSELSDGQRCVGHAVGLGIGSLQPEPVSEQVFLGFFGDLRFRDSPRMSLFPNTGIELPGSISSAVCHAREDASDPVLLVARYPSEDPLQHDLAHNGFKWYCFAADHGSLVVLATRAEDRVVAFNGFGVSPIVEPLMRFGFNVYDQSGSLAFTPA